MTMFWILATGLCVVAAAFVALPLMFAKKKYARLHADNAEADGRESRLRQGINVAIYDERLSEYQHALAAEEIDQAAFNVLEIELKKNLISETSAHLEVENKDYVVGRLPFAFAILVPLFAMFAYADVGMSWGSIDDLVLANEMRDADPHDKQGMARSVAKLSKKLKQEPDNHEGWFLLAQSYLNMREYEKSAEAFQFLINKFPQDHGLASYYAETIYLADDRKMTKRAIAAIDRTLSLNPADVTMLEIKAMGAFQSGDLKGALSYFQRAGASNPDPDRAELISRAITRIKEDLVANGIDVQDIASGTDSSVASMKPAEGIEKRSIQVLVEVDDKVDVGASMSVFVFARALNGPPMPLAVERMARGDLPKLVVLDESMAMMAGMGLANFDKVQVVARISSSGIANVSPDDYQALSDTIDLTTENNVIKLRISKQVKDFK